MFRVYATFRHTNAILNDAYIEICWDIMVHINREGSGPMADCSERWDSELSILCLCNTIWSFLWAEGKWLVLMHRRNWGTYQPDRTDQLFVNRNDDFDGLKGWSSSFMGIREVRICPLPRRMTSSLSWYRLLLKHCLQWLGFTYKHQTITWVFSNSHCYYAWYSSWRCCISGVSFPQYLDRYYDRRMCCTSTSGYGTCRH